MILFVDDEPEFVKSYLDEISLKGLETRLVTSVQEFQAFLEENISPQCVVLDMMFPADRAFPEALTSHGLTTGMPLFASLRSRFRDVPIVVFTNSSSIEVKSFFRKQENCSFYYKIDLLPHDLAEVVAGLAENRGQRLLEQLRDCPSGNRSAKVYERLCVSVLEYLFVPPLQRVIFQSRRSDGHVIRDAIMPNNSTSFFWSSIRSELDAKHIVAEFKNLSAPVGKAEVLQMREYLGRKSLGRFRLLISRFNRRLPLFTRVGTPTATRAA